MHAHSVGSIIPPKFQVQLECMNVKRIFLVCLRGPQNTIGIFQSHGPNPHGWIMLCVKWTPFGSFCVETMFKRAMFCTSVAMSNGPCTSCPIVFDTKWKLSCGRVLHLPCLYLWVLHSMVFYVPVLSFLVALRPMSKFTSALIPTYFSFIWGPIMETKLRIFCNLTFR